MELVASPLKVNAVFTTKPELLASLNGDFRKETVSIKDMEKMSGLTTPSEIIAIGLQPEPNQISFDSSLILALDGIRDPGNMGTIIRTARWFGVTTIMCSSDCVDVYNPKVVQGAMGALFHTSIVSDNLVEKLIEAKTKGFSLVTATLDGCNVYLSQLPSKNVLVIGNESNGVSDMVQELSDIQVKIPNYEIEQQVESLNAATATAILLSVITQGNKN